MSTELRLFVPVAVRAIMSSLVPRLEAAAGAPITQLIDLNPAILERILAGEAYDIGLTNPRYARALIAAGGADGASHRAFGRVPLAVGRKEGSDHAIARDVDEIKALFRDANSIAYTGTGTSGRTYLDVMERLGLTGAVAPKSRTMGGGEPVKLVAAGQIELAVGPLSTIQSTEGIVAAAVFPEELGCHIDISVLLSSTPHPGAASVLEFLTSGTLDVELAEAGLSRFKLE